MTKDNGGPAFPQHIFHHTGSGGGKWQVEGGLSMRDWFAGQALATAYAQSEHSPDHTAEWAYAVADAMLAARGGNHE